MNRADMEDRTKRFALRIIKLVTALPKDRQGDILGRQLLKSGTSIGANYREAGHASSRKHFVTLIEISQREASETIYWLELITDSNMVSKQRMTPLLKESKELLAILTSTIRSAKKAKA